MMMTTQIDVKQKNISQLVLATKAVFPNKKVKPTTIFDSGTTPLIILTQIFKPQTPKTIDETMNGIA